LLLNDSSCQALEMARALRRSRGAFSQYVLVSRLGQPYTKDGLQANWARLMKRWGGERFQLRDLRAKSGSDHETGQHLGHQSDRILKKHYRRAAEEVSVLEIKPKS
jgi:integrase